MVTASLKRPRFKLPGVNLARFFVGEGAEPTPIELVQRRVYILPTRHGLFFVGLLIVMLLGAINYNTSLGYGLIFLLVSVGLITMLHTYRNLLALRLDVAAIAPVFAGEPMTAPIILQAPPASPRYSVEIAFVGRPWTRVDIPAGQATRVRLDPGNPGRGRHALPRMTLRSIYPLGLFQAWAHCQPDHEFLIYPAPDTQHDLPRESTYHLNLTGYLGHGSDDFAGLRNYHPGDSLRHVHWKSFARGQGLNTKQFGGDRADELWLDWEALSGLDTEARLSRLCRWVIDAERGQFRYGLKLPHTSIPLGHGPQHYHQCLEALAVYPVTGPAPRSKPGKRQ